MPETPDYTRWDTINEFDVHTAAFLLLDLEPYQPTRDRPLPPVVQTLAIQIDRELKPDRDMRKVVHSPVGFSRRRLSGESQGAQLQSRPGARYYSRERLVEYAQANKLHTPAFLVELRAPRPLAGPATQPNPLWPWGEYETPLLRVLAETAERFWVNYDPSQPDTAPTNQQVVEWLISQKVSGRVAHVIATILRDERISPGPRK